MVERQKQRDRCSENRENPEDHRDDRGCHEEKSHIVVQNCVTNEPGFILLGSHFCKTLHTEMSDTETDRADFAEKPAAVIAWSYRMVSRVKVTDSFVLKREKDCGARRRFFVAFRENVGLDTRTACRTLHRLPRNKLIDRQWLTAVRATQICDHLTKNPRALFRRAVAFDHSSVRDVVM
jgi:hypothetical protein